MIPAGCIPLTNFRWSDRLRSTPLVGSPGTAPSNWPHGKSRRSPRSRHWPFPGQSTTHAAPPAQHSGRSCAVLEAVRHRLGDTNNADGHATNNLFHDDLDQRRAGKPHKAQWRVVQCWGCLIVDRQPKLKWQLRSKLMEAQGRHTAQCRDREPAPYPFVPTSSAWAILEDCASTTRYGFCYNMLRRRVVGN